MADNVTRVVTADVYAWMTPIEGAPGRYHHNIAARGETVEVSVAEASRGEGLGLLEDPAAVREAAASDDGGADELVGAAGGGSARPPRAAAKSAWVEYAVSQGADPVEAEASSKDDLVATYGA